MGTHDGNGTGREAWAEFIEYFHFLALAAAGPSASIAQGSAFQHVVIPIVGSKLLDRTLIYTAVTRAVRAAVLVGDESQLRAAIESAPAAVTRRVALAF